MFALIGTTEILIIAGVVVLLFGAKKVPELARGLGEGLREFKKSAKAISEDEKEEKKPEEKAE